MNIKQTLYSKRPNLVYGFHGCDSSVVQMVINGGNLKDSENDYDWLGHGIYFWENNKDRALLFATETAKRNNSSIKTPAVLGAVIDLGYCLDLIDSLYLDELKEAHKILQETFKLTGKTMPTNEGNTPDKLLRKLDCAVIEIAHTINQTGNVASYDSVRGVFWEGEDLYPKAFFKEKNHIQLCIRNPNCIKGFFIPREVNTSFILP